MPKAKRGEIWIADLGMIAKVRPVLVLSVSYQENERALATCVLRTTSMRGGRFEVPHHAHGMPTEAFDAQGITTVPDAKLERRLGSIDSATLSRVEQSVRSWLNL
jgi:mRNA interferase MazF